MNPSDTFQPHPDPWLDLESRDISNHGHQMTRDAGMNSLNSNGLKKFQLSILIGAALITSGLFHLTLLWVTWADWSGPLSLRKPGLFGVSAGMTVWSIVWVLTHFKPRRDDHQLAVAISGGLLLEVGLITLQYWRGVPSHFNRSTDFDATIESVMLGLILLVTAGIAWLCWRSRDLQPMIASRAIAIRAGLFLLLISCGLGLLATIIGEMNLAKGGPPEIWGRSGILKYPHGAALHAIQALPLLSALLQKLRVANSVRLLRSALMSQLLFLVHALWQTFRGRTRMDVNVIGGVTLAVAVLLLLPLLVAIIRGAVLITREFWFGQPPVQMCLRGSLSEPPGCTGAIDENRRIINCRK